MTAPVEGPGAAPSDPSAVVLALIEYCARVDRREAAPVGELFCPDATLELVSGPASGRDAIIEAFRTTFLNRDVTTTHAVGDIDVDVAGDRARLSARLLFLRESPNGAALGRGTYDDEYRFIGDRWLIASKRIQLDRPLTPLAHPTSKER